MSLTRPFPFSCTWSSRGPSSPSGGQTWAVSGLRANRWAARKSLTSSCFQSISSVLLSWMSHVKWDCLTHLPTEKIGVLLGITLKLWLVPVWGKVGVSSRTRPSRRAWQAVARWLFSCDSRAKNGSYIFKWLREKNEKNTLGQVKIP